MEDRALSMPSRIQWSIECLARSIAREGYKSAQVGVSEGRSAHASLFDECGNQEFFTCDNGRWRLVLEREAD